MTNECIHPAIPLYRPWPARWLDAVLGRWPGRSTNVRRARFADLDADTDDHDLAVLESLSAHTLKDIGAPAWVQARAAARRDVEHDRLNALLGPVRPFHSTRW